MKILFGTLFLLVAFEDAIDKDIWRGVPVWEARKSRLNLIYKLSNVLGCIFVCFAIAGRLNWRIGLSMYVFAIMLRKIYEINLIQGREH